MVSTGGTNDGGVDDNTVDDAAANSDVTDNTAADDDPVDDNAREDDGLNDGGADNGSVHGTLPISHCDLATFCFLPSLGRTLTLCFSLLRHGQVRAATRPCDVLYLRLFRYAHGILYTAVMHDE